MRPIARNLRRLRLQRELSLSGLARAAGVAKATVWKIERGDGNPSVDTLWALAEALAVPFASLFSETDGPSIEILRFEEAPLVSRAARGSAAHEGRGFETRHLLSRHARGELELYWLDLEAGAKRDARPHATGVIEHVVVTSGRIDVGVEENSTVLCAGDRMTFPADRPHHYHALDGPARAFVLLDYQ
jgi:transcriptional regulator with XRE-family HTH domain